ncbi:hypothetical protein SMX51_002815 [Cronobacter sakazakii]|uniref:hypothetical protein n=1 Tax=Cronobacter sakazakii TaxID=28141 RepID=UPI001319FA30|nr:hypothetical protein [Cronobacter sakazakii]ELY3748296.1 hypothetical protein [Cronobacter sakazakii]
MKSTSITLVALALTACSNTPVPTNMAKEVKGSQVLTSKYSTAASESGTVIIKRDSGKMGSICTVHVFIDGTPLAKLESEEKITAYLLPGSHIVSADPKGACTGGLSEQSITITAGSTQVYRASFSSAGDFSLSPTAF